MKVEVFNLHSYRTCQLADFPVSLWRHSICGLLVCGGGTEVVERSCLLMNPLTGEFTSTPVRLLERRQGHLCWKVDGEDGPTLLMGGKKSLRSTELVSADGSSTSASFNLKYDTE